MYPVCLFHSISQTYYQARVGTLDKLEAKNKLLYTLSQPQSIIVNCFPVKRVLYLFVIDKSLHGYCMSVTVYLLNATLQLNVMYNMQASDDLEELVLAVDSDKAFLCQEEEGGKLKVVLN